MAGGASMRTPIIVVTGGIASGKTTVAEVLAARGGALVDCDVLARRALALDDVKRRLVGAFGQRMLTRAGNISKARLRSVVFSDDARMEALNEIVRPHVTRIITEEIMRLRGAFPYIVLDAVLFFHYTFRFKVDLVVVTAAARRVRIARLMKRDGLTREEASRRMERQRYLEKHWRDADHTIRTEGARGEAVRAAERIRDLFLARHNISRRIQ